MGNALSTKGAFGIGNRHIIHSANIGIGTGILYIPNITALYLAANLETAHTFYALLGIPMIVDRSEDEKDDLAKAEWIKVYGVIFGCEDQANALYNKAVQQAGEK